MKQSIRIIILMLAILLPAWANAYDFEYNGIYYNKNGTELTVTWGSGSYSGYVYIPASFKYDGRTYTVTCIGYQAFWNCADLYAVSIPNTVTRIETRAFWKCSNLVDINIPNSVADISGTQTFAYCSSLTSITLSNSMTVIGEHTFEGCSGLKNVTIPNSITTIGDCSFWLCTSLESIDIPNSVTTIETDAFCECSSLTSIDIPNSVTHLGGSAFYGCSNLTSVTLPNTITTLESALFYDCTSLSCIDIPNTITSIGKSTFRGTSLTSIVIPDRVTSIGDKAFCNCPLEEIYCMATEPPLIEKYTFSEYIEGNFIEKYDAILYVPQGTEVAYKAADYWENFLNVIGISIIDDFEVDGIYYHALSENTATVIKHPVIENYYNGDVVIPDSVSYQDMQFAVVGIDDRAFEDCSELISVVIGNLVESIGEEAFQGCTSLTNLTIGSGVTTIGAKAFNYCNSLQTVACLGTVPPLMENSNCFSTVAYRNAILFVPDGLIETYAATDYWYKFEKIMGDFEVDGIYYHALSGNTAIVIKHPYIENYYVGDVIIPDSVSYQGLQFAVVGINDKAFEDCSELINVVIGNLVESIGEEAFQGCTGLESITIGSGVATIGAKAFNYCNSLQTVTCLGTVPPLMENSNCFSSAAYRNAILYVPEGLIEAYSAADYWYKFEKIMDHEPAIKGDVNGDGEVNIADINAVIDMILSGTFNANGDVNGDGEVNIADINAVIDLILS